MNSMFITPIAKMNSLDDLQKVSIPSKQSADLPFQSVFEDAMNNVQQTRDTLNQEVYKLSTGQTDNLHDITIASTKASLSVEMFVQLRNKAMDAYNEIMRMGI